MTMKIGLKIKNTLQRYDINRPKLRGGSMAPVTSKMACFVMLQQPRSASAKLKHGPK